MVRKRLLLGVLGVLVGSIAAAAVWQLGGESAAAPIAAAHGADAVASAPASRSIFPKVLNR